MAHFLGIDFAPIHLPLKRRLQTLAVLIVCNEFLFLGLLSSSFLLFLLFSPFFLFTIGYITWMVYDKETCKRGYSKCRIF
ncbi:diacylglycerol O-acyltransferase-like protein [Leptotrombidium deliense]|uniref:Diacylglycerol O-acyltransferase-like protein n=1 Tax=Leptotrombidium deliense TaxID=299467 RepID=A0A443S9Z3_9ACAR|nr:diacylglycerol O-acyltransferase-like protein [Leptotrombidium deliense]